MGLNGIVNKLNNRVIIAIMVALFLLAMFRRFASRVV